MGDGKFHKVQVGFKRLIGQCADSEKLEAVTKAVETGSKRIDQVVLLGRAFDRNPEVLEKLNKVSEPLRRIEKVLKTTKNVCLDLEAVGKIMEAKRVLDDDRIFGVDAQATADAFDQIFQGFGRLCHWLPSPAKDVGKELEKFKLFGNFQRNILSPYHQRIDDAVHGDMPGR